MTQNKPAEWAVKAACEAFNITVDETRYMPTDWLTAYNRTARAIEAAANAATERERERCIKTLNDQISYCRLRAEEKRTAGNKKSEDTFILMANTLSYQISAIRKGGDND